ncbi:hypothetical protein BKA62DRAFT_692056 [Auriculariales sp. MPI-PUGE-AT-0066]|nr:hypothetical protein BKA62DRAFT_692056 [Auriculariales sp. MPI-PUGE-AT-0066]
MFLFLRRVSAFRLAFQGAEPVVAEETADEAEVERLLVLEVEEQLDHQKRLHAARSITYEFEIKTEDEDEGSLAGIGDESSDAGESPPARSNAPTHKVVVEVPQLTPEERETYQGSPVSSVTGRSVTRAITFTYQSKSNRAKASKPPVTRRTTAQRHQPESSSKPVPVVRTLARRRASQTEPEDHSNAPRLTKRRKVEPSSEAEAPRPVRVTRRRTTQHAPSIDTDESGLEVSAPKRAARARLAKLPSVFEETTVARRTSSRKMRT